MSESNTAPTPPSTSADAQPDSSRALELAQPGQLDRSQQIAAQGSPIVDLSALQPNEAVGYLMLSPQHWTNLCAQAEQLVSGQALPKSIRTPAQAAAIGLKGIEMGIPFLSALAGMRPIDGEICVLGKLALRLIQQRAVSQGAICDPIPVPYEEQAQRAGWKMARPGKEPQEFWYTIEQAEKAGLLRIRNKGGEWIDAPAWKNHPERMLRWRALAAGANYVFADILQGCYIAEELEHRDPAWIDGQLVEAGEAPAHRPGPSFHDKPPEREEIDDKHERSRALLDRVNTYAELLTDVVDGESESDRKKRVARHRGDIWKDILGRHKAPEGKRPTLAEVDAMIRELTVRIDAMRRNGAK
jgi:hypothetical protein